MVTSVVNNRQLIVRMIRREVVGRYRGSVMGITWSFLNPLVLLSVYTFVFSVVFKARWHAGSDSKSEFALVLFVGMIAHGLLAECVNRAPGLILSNVSYVKKVIFPLEILPWITLGAALFHSLVSLLVWSVFFVLVHKFFHWTAVFLPLVFLPLILFSMGLAWLLASLGVFFKDIGQMTGMFTTVLLFVSPVLYPVANLPQRYQKVLYANPLTFIIEQSRAVLIQGELPNWPGLAAIFSISLIVAWLGFSWFQKTRRGFADVL